jgi:hypothetical protein
MLIEPESVRDLPQHLRQTLPPLEQRMHLIVGAQVRLIVLLDGELHEYPWVSIAGITDAGYIGRVIQACEHVPGKRIEVDTVIPFTADNIIEY